MIKDIITFIFAACILSAQAQTDGTFCGTLKAGTAAIPLRLNITVHGCSLDSPNQGAYGIELDTDTLAIDTIAVSSKILDANYRAKIEQDTIDGIFTQRGLSFPLIMIRQTENIHRPQTPKPPYPYSTIDTVFYNEEAGIKLAGTLFIPEQEVIATAVLVSGSGAQNRDEEIFDHKPFLVLADRLARNGIATLRYDDRGFGLSEGNFATATTFDFASDAQAAIDFAKTLNLGPTGIIGHSEGGSIAFIVSSSKPVDFIVSMAGAILPGKEILLAQNRHSLEKSGLSEDIVENILILLDSVFDNIAMNREISLKKIACQLNLDIPDTILESLRKNDMPTSPWYKNFIKLNTARYISDVTCPVLAIGGDRDTQIDAKANLEVLERILPDVYTMIYSRLNHMFQHCATGEIEEYSQIEETMAEEVIDEIISFIHNIL